MNRKTKKRLITLGVVLGIALLVVLGYWLVLKNLTVGSDKVIKCGQKSQWNSIINASELVYTVENEYCVTEELNGGSVHGYRLPVGKYGLISFGTANVYIYEELDFDNGESGYYETWIVNFYTGSEVIQKNNYSAPGVYESEYAKDYIEITKENNLVMVNGNVDFYMDPEK